MSRDFVHCQVCDLVSVPRRFHVGAEAERQRYLEHNNDPDDPDYRAFLDRLWTQMKPRLDPGAKGLDYGAGPGPALAAMMAEDGFDGLGLRQALPTRPGRPESTNTTSSCARRRPSTSTTLRRSFRQSWTGSCDLGDGWG